MLIKAKVSIKNVKYGLNTKIVQPVNLYGCRLEKIVL